MEVMAQYDVLVPAFQKAVANTSAADLDTQTPCTEWKVRDLFDHLIGGASHFAAVARGQEPPAPAETPDAAKAAAASSAVADVDDAFRSPGALERILDTPFGRMPGDAFARLLAFDLLMHTWDLATATGQALDIPEDVVAAVDGFARGAIAPEMRVPGAFGPEVQPAPNASPLARLVAFSGRAG